MNSFNQEIINQYINDYKTKYIKQFNQEPKSWFAFLQWLSSFTLAGSFDSDDIEFAKGYFQN